MFTGLIKDIGTVIGVDDRGDRYFKIAANFNVTEIELGASICCSGICLTVVSTGTEDGISWFEVCVSPETMNLTTTKYWKIGTAVNLEKSLRLQDELGGHLVTGHVDVVGYLEQVVSNNDCWKMKFKCDKNLRVFIARKGSICIDGISLTVNEVGRDYFWVMIIPHTYEKTNLKFLKEKDQVNIEIDLMARYAYNILQNCMEVEDA